MPPTCEALSTRKTLWPASARSMAERIPLMPPPITTVDPVFTAIFITPFLLDPHYIRKLIFLENQERRLLLQTTAWLVFKSSLSTVGDRSKKLYKRNIIRTGIGTLTAANA